MANKPTGSRKSMKQLAQIPALTFDNVALNMIQSPERLARAEAHRDLIRIQYDVYLAGLTVNSYGAAIFPGKGEGEKRTAANEAERKAALDYVTASDPDFMELRQVLEAAQRDVCLFRNQVEAYQLAARLLIAQAKSS